MCVGCMIDSCLQVRRSLFKISKWEQPHSLILTSMSFLPNHDDKAVPLSWAGHRLLNPHKAVEEPRLKFSTRLCRFRILVLVRVILNFYHGTWHYFFYKICAVVPGGYQCVSVCFFSQFCDVVTLTIIDKEILATVGYRPAMKVGIY